MTEPAGARDDEVVDDTVDGAVPPGRLSLRDRGRLVAAAARSMLGPRGSRRRRVVLLLAIATVLLFVLAGFADEIYDDFVADDSATWIDRDVLAWMVAHRVPGFTTAVVIFSQSGGPVWMPVIVGATAAALSIAWRTWSPLLLTAIAAAGSLLMTTVGKDLVGRQRPPIADAVPPYETSFSFPSGHSLNSLVLAGVIGYLVFCRLRTRTARIAWLAFVVVYVLAMGMSRVYLGHHWLSDVLMAWVLGLAWLTIVIIAHRLWRTARSKRQLRAAVLPSGATEDASPRERTSPERHAADGPDRDEPGPHEPR